MSIIRIGLGIAFVVLPMFASAETSFDAAKAFGALESIRDLSLSPDGRRVAYVAPTGGSGYALYTIDLEKGAIPKRAYSANGKPERLLWCDWVSNDRLVCRVYWVAANVTYDVLPFSREIAVDADGANAKLLSRRDNENMHGFQLSGGNVIDFLPDENGAVLMTRQYVPDDVGGTRTGSDKRGLGVDRIDTRTLIATHVEQPREHAVEYLSDGRGAVRIMGLESTRGVVGDEWSGAVNYVYRLPDSKEWKPLSTFDSRDGSGFNPYAIDHDLNVAYGFKKQDGRFALFSVALDGSLQEKLIFSRPDVDVTELLHIGRRHRVVGVRYTTDYGHAVYFDPVIAKLLAALGRALPDSPMLGVVDASLDESKLLIRGASDHDPGVYYLFDRNSHQLNTFLVVRDQLEGVKLATVKPITYPASDGTLIPGYLTLPPSADSAKGLPAIVMPHGGPSARDEWRFDWLAQFYANRGYAVLQPNFRGSNGYGDAWLENNGFQSWRRAIGDVVDAGRWLVSEGIADPSKLAIVGWSYGGYAALQSAVVAPDLFKAVVAIAPVTDFASLKESRRNWTDFTLVSQYIGDGPHIREGSPAQNADKIKAPVLMFQGLLDRNVPIGQSRLMDDRLKKAGVPHELVTWPDLDHQLEDSDARAEMLRKSDAFLHKSMNF